MSALQMNDAKDQAAGLRHLFGESTAPVHFLHCPSRPALCLPLAQSLSKDLAERGHTVMWVDEVGLDKREQWPLPCKVRFDLSKSLQGHVALDQGVTPLLSSLLWYGLSVHTARIAQPTEPLTERLKRSGLKFDSVVISGAANQVESLSHYGSQLHYTLITECSDQALHEALQWMQRAQVQCPAASWSVVLAGTKSRLASGTKWVEQTAKTHLDQSVRLLGFVDAKIMSAPLASAWASAPDLADMLMQHLLTP